MIRRTAAFGGLVCLLATLARGLCQDTPPADNQDSITVERIDQSQVAEYSKKPGTRVIGSLAGEVVKEKGKVVKDEEGNDKLKPGHDVLGVPPGKDERFDPNNPWVWDGDTLGGLQDLAAGTEITAPAVFDRIETYLRFQKDFQGAIVPELAKLKDEVKELPHGNNATKADKEAYKKAYHDKLNDFLKKASSDDRKKWLDDYNKHGASYRQSWKDGDRQKVTWYAVTTKKNVDVRAVVKNWKPPSGWPQDMRCNSLPKAAAPVERLVMDELATKEKPKPDAVANNIDKALAQRAKKTKAAEPAPTVQPPPNLTPTPIPATAPRERKVETKPGGVIITAVADIDDLKPEEIATATFDTSTGILTLKLRSGKTVTIRLDIDDFTVAVRCVFDRQVDPSLSMSYEREKPGYKAVNYCGPLFQTHFGKVMYETDELLGDIIFNREGDHRIAAAEIIPHFADLVCEAYQTMSLGSRVFLHASGARFAVREGRLVCRAIQTRIDVEGAGYATDYYQDSLHRLARAMDEQFDSLAEEFEAFQDFRQLVECVALAKWIKRHSIPFDWSELKTRAVTENDFPAYSPAVQWSCLFNGRNLDGWRFNLRTGEFDWTQKGSSVTLKPTGTRALEVLSSVYRNEYDLRYMVITEGPVEFIVRNGSGEGGASIAIDTKGSVQRVELFLVKGEWTAIAPRFGKTGKVVIPKPKKDEAQQPNDFGLRVPPGSKLTLFTASLRGR
jgi:hypothetical protein